MRAAYSKIVLLAAVVMVSAVGCTASGPFASATSGEAVHDRDLSVMSTDLSGPLTYAVSQNGNLSRNISTANLAKIFSCTLGAGQVNYHPMLPIRTGAHNIARTWITDVLHLPNPGPCVIEYNGDGTIIAENDLRGPMQDVKAIIPVEVQSYLDQKMAAPGVSDFTSTSRLGRVDGIYPLELGPSTRSPYWPPSS